MGAAIAPDIRKPAVTGEPNPRIPWVQIALMTGIIGLLYGWTLVDLASDWWNYPHLTQGLLIPPLAVWIAWLQRGVTFGHPVAPDRRGIWLVAAACFLYLLGKAGAEFFLMRISFVILLAGIAWSFWGRARLSPSR
jgi:hypothetical protein